MIYTFSNFGYEGNLVQVETDFRRGIPAIDIVGISDVAVKETRERALAAIKNSGIKFTYERVLVAFSPCDLKKDYGMSLPLALSILCKDLKENWLIYGELNLDGTLKPIRGLHAAVSTALSCGITKCIVTSHCSNEAYIDGMEVYEASTLNEALNIIKSGGVKLETPKNNYESVEVNGVEFVKEDEGVDISKFTHGKAYNALALAIASGENVLFFGAPGCGKTLVMQSSKYLMPILTDEESQSVTRIHSLAGLVRPNERFIKIPPFRMPHQTASIEGICGGGIHCNPGEISLAHNGVLFLDEASEFRSSVLQMLRVPLESKAITLSRAGRSTVFPAKFQLFMATNPCPCGNYGSVDKICLCSAKSIEMYWKKFSAPLLDRVAIRLEIEKDSTVADLNELRSKIANARKKSLKRGFKWADVTPNELEMYIKQNGIKIPDMPDDYSPRSKAQIIHLALALADMNEHEVPTEEDWAVAKSYRKIYVIDQF